MTFTEQSILLDGLKARYWEDGENHSGTLLLIHGGIGDAHLHWASVMPMLAETFHVLAPDLPGFGESELLPQMRTDVLLHWIKTFLDAKNVEQAVVIGNSFGGLIARLFAAANPIYVPAVVLVNGGGLPNMPLPMRLIERVPGLADLLFGMFGRMATSQGTLKRLLHIQSVLTDEFYRTARLAAPGFARTMRMMVRTGFPDKQTPQVATLLLWGVNDQFAPIADAEKIKASIPGATLTEITDCGHMPQLETPDVFTWQINTFLNRQTNPQVKHSGPKLLGTLSG